MELQGGNLSAAIHAASHCREGSSSARRGILLREKSRIAEAVLTSKGG